MKKSQGFTLTELLVVVVIAAILASLAIPSYREAVRRSDRRAAQAAIRFFSDEDELGFTLPAELEGKYTFTIDVDAGPPPSFEINFTAAGAQAADGNLSLDSAGVKTPAEKW